MHICFRGGFVEGPRTSGEHVPFSGALLCQGLVIDDYIALSCGGRGQDRAAVCFEKSQQACASRNILGSPLKDVKGERRAKIIGTEIKQGCLLWCGYCRSPC